MVQDEDFLHQKSAFTQNRENRMTPLPKRVFVRYTTWPGHDMPRRICHDQIMIDHSHNCIMVRVKTAPHRAT
jgi:hypothetical protein